MEKINEWIMAHFFELILVLSVFCLAWVSVGWMLT